MAVLLSISLASWRGMVTLALLPILALLSSPSNTLTASAFTITPKYSPQKSFILPDVITSSIARQQHAPLLGLCRDDNVDKSINDADESNTIENNTVLKRRDLLKNISGSMALLQLTSSSFMPLSQNVANAIDVSSIPSSPAPAVEMKTFDDPMGLFSIRVPKKFYTLRRSAKGDLPDAKTGKGRRGSSIFTAGDMAKAEVVAIERFPVRVFLEEEGILPSGDLSTFPALGKPETIATLLNLRREKDKTGQSQTKVIPSSVKVSDDGKTLTFQLRTQIEVQKPELLMEQMGVSELVRMTLGRAELRSDDEQIMACYASALQQDFEGTDGFALRDTIDSFEVLK